jgi:hypothetical protein
MRAISAKRAGWSPDCSSGPGASNLSKRGRSDQRMSAPDPMQASAAMMARKRICPRRWLAEKIAKW